MDEPRVRDRRPLRQRVSKACDSCRTRKDRCDGRKPSCSSCLKLGRPCVYNTPSKKRGLKEGYVRGLEKLWALAIRRIPHLEQQLVKILSDAKQSGSQQDELLVEWLESDESRSLIKTWKDSKLHKEFDQTLEFIDSLPDKAAKREPDLSSSILGSITPAKPADLQFSDIEIASNNDLGDLWQPERFEDTRPLSSRTEDELRPLSSHVLLKPKLPSAAWQLLEFYFSFTHCWFGILEKHDVVKTLYEISNGDSNIQSENDGSHALIWALLAYAESQYSTLKNSQLNESFADQKEMETVAMFDYSRSLIPLDPGKLDLFHIQALLLLTLSSMQSGQWEKAWIVVGQAARATLVMAAGSERRETLANPAPGHTDRGPHVYYGCFLLDTIVSARIGRRPQLREIDLNSISPVNESGLEEWEPWKGTHSTLSNNPSFIHGPCAGPSIYNQVVKVFRNLNRHLCLDSDHVDIAASDNIFEELRSWGRDQPFFSHMDLSVQGKSHIKYPLLPHQIHLRLSYIAALLHLYTRSSLLRSKTYFDYVLALIGQGCRLIEKHAIFFGYGTLPPTYEYFAHVICNSLETMHSHGINFGQIRGDLRDMKDSTSDISIIWPGFEPIRERFHAIFDKMAHQTLLGSTEFSSSAVASSKLPLSHVAPFSGISGAPLSEVQSSNPDGIPDNALTDPGTAAASDVDSVLQDFGTIDAMEWMNNWEESLTHLGFAEGASNQEFHSFWQSMQS